MFIESGLQIYLDGRQVCLHDPLYHAGPTQFDTKEKQDPKAEIYSHTTLDWEIPDKNGEKAPLTIRLSLLPKEWRLNIGDGRNINAKKRKIDQNEGVSILRANREVLYDKVPYLIGTKVQYSYEENDRWWGCEISFPPELDGIQCQDRRIVIQCETNDEKIREGIVEYRDELQNKLIYCKEVITSCSDIEFPYGQVDLKFLNAIASTK